MAPVLILVDMQKDFLARPGIEPSPVELVERAVVLLRQCREMGVPVIHVHMVVDQDGANAMPHWQHQGIRECIKGTPGVMPPEELRPVEGELVFTKQFFSPFRDGHLEQALMEMDASPVIVAGLFLHGCIRSTVLDVYERGYQVWVADDVTGDNDSVHGDITRRYLSGRAAIFRSSSAILRQLRGLSDLGCRHPATHETCMGYIHGRWVESRKNPATTNFNPSDSAQVLSVVASASGADIAEAVRAVKGAGFMWQEITSAARAKLLDNWADQLEESCDELVLTMARELGKPVGVGQEEVAATVRMVRQVIVPAVREHQQELAVAKGMVERRQALGIVAIITPWNNPVLIPVGKIAPAMGFGNGIVWKPSPKAMLTTRVLVNTLERAGVPPEVFAVLTGEAMTAVGLTLHPDIDAVTFTGSCRAGAAIARLCATFPKPLQAELGGNNGVIIMPDADPQKIAEELVRAAFSFCGQRCTALKRFIVHHDILPECIAALVTATRKLQLGSPFDRQTDIGPVISHQKQQELQLIVAKARCQGAELLCGGDIPNGMGPGSWFSPTLFFAPSADLDVVREEIFGPVAVVQSAKDWDEAIWLLNDVRQGLVASLYTSDPLLQSKFQREAQCGMLKLNQPTVGADPAMPFIGWKGSGLGPPEHGRWDREFYTRPQALYGW
jgi:acyl-CoA reductase-like NAD-dependent aldehyde dehydrogenase/nicotinamidase-related amidase